MAGVQAAPSQNTTFGNEHKITPVIKLKDHAFGYIAPAVDESEKLIAEYADATNNRPGRRHCYPGGNYCRIPQILSVAAMAASPIQDERDTLVIQDKSRKHVEKPRFRTQRSRRFSEVIPKILR